MSQPDGKDSELCEAILPGNMLSEKMETCPFPAVARFKFGSYTYRFCQHHRETAIANGAKEIHPNSKPIQPY